MLPRSRHKFNASRARYKDHLYDSKMEANHAALLDKLKKARDPLERVRSWERQVKVPLDVNGTHITNWYADFKVTFADGHHEWHEVKGMQTELWRIKKLLFLALYPNEILREIRHA